MYQSHPYVLRVLVDDRARQLRLDVQRARRHRKVRDARAVRRAQRRPPRAP